MRTMLCPVTCSQPDYESTRSADRLCSPHHETIHIASIVMKMATSELERQLQATEEWQKAQQGLGYNGNIPEMIAARARCAIACDALNDSRDYSRRNQVELWRR